MSIITIDGSEYQLRYSLRGLFVFEKITGRPYAGTSAFDLYVLFYACILAHNEDFSMEVKDFINVCDDDPRLIAVFRDVIEKRNVRDKVLLTGVDDDEKKKTQRK